MCGQALGSFDGRSSPMTDDWEKSMDWMLHHVNVPAYSVRETAAFLRDVIGLPEGRWIYPETVGELHHDDDGIAYFGIENRGLHVVRSIPSFARDNRFFHNPTIGGHFAISVPDVEAVKARLVQAGVLVSDAGVYAMAGIHQIYCYDPSFNLIEINQIKTPLPEDAMAQQDAAADIILRHVAIPAHDVRESADFFGHLIGLGNAEISEGMARFEQGGQGLRLIKPSVTYGREHDLLVNPTLDPYFAMTISDLPNVMRRLDGVGIAYGKAPPDPLDGTGRLFVYTPSMRLVALYQE